MNMEKELLKYLDDGTILLFHILEDGLQVLVNHLQKNKINIVMKEVILDSIKNIEKKNIDKTTSNIKIIDQSLGQLVVSIKIAMLFQTNRSNSYYGR